MIPGIGAAHIPALHAGSTMREIIHALGLTTSLQVLLDAGDSASYTSGQTWTDLSGGGNSFYRGSGSGSDSADPTFNGTAGGRSRNDYFSYDGGDQFTLAQSAPSWQSGMHKSAGKFTIIQWAYVGNLTALAPTQNGFGCGDATSSSDGKDAITFSCSASTQNALSVAVADASGVAVVGNRSTILVTNNSWQMVAAAVDVAAESILFAVNGTTETRANVGTASASAANSHVPLVLGAVAADGYSTPINGCRLAVNLIWTRALSATEIKAFFNASRAKFAV